MEQTGKRDSAIELVRVVAMFMIIFDHMLLPINLPCKSIISQFLNSGVYIFIILSGYLAGKKVITDWKSWYIKKIKRIMIPYWIVIGICLIYESIYTQSFNWKIWIVHILNVQGIFGTAYTTNPLWFVTLIMILYLITPIYQWIEQKFRKWLKVILAVLIILQIILAYTTDVGLQYGHNLSWCIAAITGYGIGYFSTKVDLKKISCKKIILFTIFTVAILGVAMAARAMLDQQPIYDKVIAYDSMMIMSLDIALIVYFIGKFINRERILILISGLDKISYEFYLIHELIIVAVGYGVFYKHGAIAYLIATIVITLIVAFAVNKFKELIEEKM